jgi:hypothetical protein
MGPQVGCSRAGDITLGLSSNISPAPTSSSRTSAMAGVGDLNASTSNGSFGSGSEEVFVPPD